MPYNHSIKINTYYDQLNGLRLFAATMVFATHFWRIFPVQHPVLNRFAAEAGMGVIIFFVLTGFLVGNRYFNHFIPSYAWTRQLITRRLIRIYPVYGILVFLVLLKQPQPLNVWIVNLSLTKGLFPPYQYYGILPSWTLTVDLMFFLFVPFIFTYWKKFRLWLTIVFLLLGTIVTIIGKQVHWHHLFTTYDFMLFSSVFGLAFDFLIGIWLGIKLASKLSKSQVKTRIKTYAGLTGMIAMWSVMVWLQNHSFNSEFAAFLVQYLIYTLGFGFAVMLTIWGLLTEKTLIRKICSHPKLQLFAGSSYVFFLIHYSSIADSLYHLVNQDFWFFYISLWAVSIAVYLCIEKPITKLSLGK